MYNILGKKHCHFVPTSSPHLPPGFLPTTCPITKPQTPAPPSHTSHLMTDHIPKYLQKCPPSPTTQTICAYLPDPYSHCQQEGPLMSLPASNLFWVNFNWSVWYKKQQAFTPHFLGDGLLLELCTYWGSCTYLSAAMHLLGPGTSWCPCTVLSTTHISIIHS